MRILVLVTDAFGGRGGIAKFNRDLIAALGSDEEITEIVAITRFAPDSFDTLPSKIKYDLSGLGGKPRYVVTVLRRIIHNRNFDLIICGHINLLPIGIICRAMCRRVPLFLIIHGIEAWWPTPGLFTNLMVRRVDAVISVSETTKQRFRGWTGLEDRKFRILPNCVDLKLFGAGPKNPVYLRRYGLEGKTVIMTFGRLASEERYKGFDEIIEIIPELVGDVPNLAYMIVGDGADRNRLEAKAKTLGVRDRVVFTGYIPEAEKAEHYRLADAYIMPSRGEGFGIVYLEAMACGIPVVASKVDGGREALRDGELGILLESDNPQELRRAIMQALSNGRGEVQAGLSYFSYNSFLDRAKQIISQSNCRFIRKPD